MLGIQSQQRSRQSRDCSPYLDLRDDFLVDRRDNKVLSAAWKLIREPVCGFVEQFHVYIIYIYIVMGSDLMDLLAWSMIIGPTPGEIARLRRNGSAQVNDFRPDDRQWSKSRPKQTMIAYTVHSTALYSTLPNNLCEGKYGPENGTKGEQMRQRRFYCRRSTDLKYNKPSNTHLPKTLLDRWNTW